MRHLALLLGLLLLLPCGVDAQPTPHRQTAAVLAHYPAIAGMKLDSPAFRRPSRRSPARTRCSVPGRARADSGKAKVASLGTSTQGRDIPVIYLTAEGLADPAAIRALGRPVIWLIGQQHGNEPAGGEAMLALASALARGELAPLSAKITVVIVPRANVEARRTTSACWPRAPTATAITCC